MQDIKQLEEIVKQQVYIRPLDLDDAKECWKIAKKAINKMVSLAVEQEKERIMEFILSEEIEMQVGDNINELLDYRGVYDCGKSMRGGAKEKVLEPLVVRITRNFNQQ